MSNFIDAAKLRQELETLWPMYRQLESELAEAHAKLSEQREQLVWAFHHEEVPQFQQGGTPHEVLELVTAKDCENMVKKIVEQQAILDGLEKQKPVGMFYIGEVTGLYHPVKQDMPKQIKDYVPLYSQPMPALSIVQENITPTLCSECKLLRLGQEGECTRAFRGIYEHSAVTQVTTGYFRCQYFVRDACERDTTSQPHKG